MSREMRCGELAQAMTAYLDGTLSPLDRDRFEAHRRGCARCRLLVEQWQDMVGSLTRMEDRAEAVTRSEKERLVALYREHGFHQPGRRPPRVHLGLDDQLAAPGDHIAFICETDQDVSATAGFVVAGAAEGETCLLLGHDDANTRLDAAFTLAGLDTAALRHQNRLRFVPGMTSAEALLGAIEEQVKSAVDRGAPLVRILGNLGWGRSGWPGDQDLLRLEARITDAVRRLPVVLMCIYDFRGAVARNLLLCGLECHPLTCTREGIRLNEHHVPAESFLAKLG